MPNAGEWNYLFKEFSEEFLAGLNNSTSALDIFTNNQVGTAVDSGTIEIPVRYMSRRIRLSQPVSKAKHRTYLDWAAAGGDRA